MVIVIRRATLVDSKAIARVQLDTWRIAYRGIVPAEYLSNMTYEKAERNWETRLLDASSGQSFYVAEDSEVVGFATCGLERSGDPVYKGELYAIYVLERHQRKGVGGQLVVAAARDLQARGLNSMLVWVLEDNPWRRFYESLHGNKVRTQEISIGGSNLKEVSYGWADINVLLKTIETRSHTKSTP